MLRYGAYHCSPFRAKRKTIGGILDIGPGHDLPTLEQQGGPDPES